MQTYEKFFIEFEKKVADCNGSCKHYYVKYIYKNNSEHYQLLCTNHGYRTNVPRDIALENIGNGATYIVKGDPSPFLEER